MIYVKCLIMLKWYYVEHVIIFFYVNSLLYVEAVAVRFEFVFEQNAIRKIRKLLVFHKFVFW